jgi:hypothetical protein
VRPVLNLNLGPGISRGGVILNWPSNRPPIRARGTHECNGDVTSTPRPSFPSEFIRKRTRYSKPLQANLLRAK